MGVGFRITGLSSWRGEGGREGGREGRSEREGGRRMRDGREMLGGIGEKKPVWRGKDEEYS